ncbi:MAG: hypothetical protein ACYC4L_03860 [Chloroflexota bacterium]
MSSLTIVETVLRDRQGFFAEIRQEVGLGAKIRAMLLASIAFLALYGAVMGSTHSLWQALSSAGKLPLLFLATRLICAPTLYFFNRIFGSTRSLSQDLALMLAAITTTSVVLLAARPSCSSSSSPAATTNSSSCSTWGCSP